MACAICQIRRPRRRCPGVEGEICALCCGTEREVTVTCPFDCEFLQEARKHEKPAPFDPAEAPNQDIRVTEQAIEEKQALAGFLAHALVEAALAIPGAADFTVREALDALIRTWRTLQSGLYYETLPQDSRALHLFRAVEQGLGEFRRRESEQGVTRTRDADVLLVLVFFQRLELDRANGRIRGRAFLNLLWEHYGAPPSAGPSSSLILP